MALGYITRINSQSLEDSKSGTIRIKQLRPNTLHFRTFQALYTWFWTCRPLYWPPCLLPCWPPCHCPSPWRPIIFFSHHVGQLVYHWETSWMDNHLIGGSVEWGTSYGWLGIDTVGAVGCSVSPHSWNFAYMLWQPMRIGMIRPETQNKL